MLFKIGIGIIVAAIVIVTILEEYIRRKRQKTQNNKSNEKGKRKIPWFWYLLAIGFLYLLASRFEPLKTINEMYPFPNTFSAHMLVVSILIISATVGFTLAFRKGRVIRKGIIAKRKHLRGEIVYKDGE